mmetsp:Transcript_30120/g.115625  ORF Transcript_30120/g.115625 Transcript_30120/m.115625 type:complete len:476 (-) Transcript_30120:394-1821(-)
MLVLFETPSGHALFKVTDSAKLKDVKPEEVGGLLAGDSLSSSLRLKAFGKFESTTDALAASTAIVEGKISKQLKKFLKKNVKDAEELAVGESKLGNAIKSKLGLQCIFDSSVQEIIRVIRANFEDLVGEKSTEHERKAMVLGLAHSLSRYKLKFSPDKVDTMIVQAIGLLDDLDKELNTYAMRLKEWYGWHFPEMVKIINDNVKYAQVVARMKIRSNAKGLDFKDILEEEVEEELKEAAEVSMGTEISDEDVRNITSLCSQVTTLSEYRFKLFEYLKNRMRAIAPNLTAMVGELVGARLIAHAGSLLNLAKYPASTVQLLGAEKALFRALKTKHATPKYGLIYHASVVGLAAPKHKGKISRVLAAKCALSIRLDALGEGENDGAVGEENRLKVENRLRQLEGKQSLAISKAGRNSSQGVYIAPDEPAKTYNDSADMIMVSRAHRPPVRWIRSTQVLEISCARRHVLFPIPFPAKH